MLKLNVKYLVKIKDKLKMQARFRIAFVGDSLISCEWVHPNWREIVEYVVKRELEETMENWKMPSWGIRCFNFGFDGATTKDILEKSDEILEVKPNLIISLMGGNIKMENKKEQLLTELKKYEEKLLQIRKDCAEFKAGGSRYGDEYGEIQSKVYTEMIETIETELKKL